MHLKNLLVTGRRGCSQEAPWALVLFWTFLFFSPVSAQEPVPFSRDFNDQETPIEITAERLQYFRKEDRYIAEGAVNVIQGALHLTADHVTLDNQTGLVKANGHVRLQEGDDLLSSDQLDFNLRTQNGVAVAGQLFVKKEHYTIDAERIDKTAGQHYELRTWSITSCDTAIGAAPLWRFRGRTSRVDLGQYLVARDVVFTIKDIPLLYTPYLILPIKTTRQSGFLVPRTGYSTADGLRVNEAFFWAISPSQDATLSLDYRSTRGIGTGLEYRYKLSRGSEGELDYTFFDDHVAKSRRTETQFRHTQRLGTDFQARLDLHLVSDINQFRDLSEATSERIQQSLVSTFVAFRQWNDQELYLLSRLTRDLVVPTDTALQQLPQVGYTLREYRLGRLPLYAGIEATAVDFWREKENEAEGLIRAQRLDLFPRLWMRMNLGGIVMTPRAGFRETWYSRNCVREPGQVGCLESDSPVQRGVEVLDMGVNTRLSRLFETAGDRRVLHHIEPAVVYEYVPFVKNQARLPNFDDLDQLPRKNSLTYSLTNRLVIENEADREKPFRREWLFWKVTQSYDIHAERVQDGPGPSRPFSNVRSEAVLRPFDQATLDLDTFYNLYEHETVSFNTDLHLKPLPPWTVGIGQRYTRRQDASSPGGDVFNPLSQSEQTFWYSGPAPLLRFLTGETRIEFPGNTTLSSRAYYDIGDRAFAEINYGLQYIGQCWAFAVAYQDLPDRNQVSFIITLRPSEMSVSRPLINF